jgi:hypothetical protein
VLDSCDVLCARLGFMCSPTRCRLSGVLPWVIGGAIVKACPFLYSAPWYLFVCLLGCIALLVVGLPRMFAELYLRRWQGVSPTKADVHSMDAEMTAQATRLFLGAVLVKAVQLLFDIAWAVFAGVYVLCVWESILSAHTA